MNFYDTVFFFSKLGKEGDSLNLINGIYKNLNKTNKKTTAKLY